MAWIEVLQDPSYGITKVASINPDAMRALHALARSVTFGSSLLTRVEEEAIAVVVSSTNRCRY